MRRPALALVFAIGCVHPASPLVLVTPSASPAPVAPAVEAVIDPACEDVEVLAIRAVIRVPALHVGRALRPVIHAACACTRAGATVRVQVRIEPEAGRVGAHVEGDQPVDACIQRTLIGAFEPFAVGSDAISRRRWLPVPRGRSSTVGPTSELASFTTAGVPLFPQPASGIASIHTIRWKRSPW